jgi:hypothetical protein
MRFAIVLPLFRLPDLNRLNVIRWLVNLIVLNFFNGGGMAKKKVQHGGKRKGAGRKIENPEGRTVFIGATVPETLVERLDALAAEREWNRSKAVTEAIRGLLDAN